MMPSFVGPLALTMSLPAQNTGGYTKRTVVVGMAFIGYCIGNMIGPRESAAVCGVCGTVTDLLVAYVEGQTPRYVSGYVTCLGCNGAQWILFAVLRWHFVRRNRIREKLLAEREADGTLVEHDEVCWIRVICASEI